MRWIVSETNRKGTSGYFGIRVGQVVMFASSVLFFGAAVWKLWSLHLDEGELVVGLLAALACMLLMMVIGLIIPMTVKRDEFDVD